MLHVRLRACALAAMVACGRLAAQDLAPAASPHCEVASDPEYAYTREQPVQVGGGAMFVASRERRYMDALRGPSGEPIRYRRLSSLDAPDGLTVLDAYEVTYDGAEKPVTLYLDAYHYDDGMRAPKGFTCGAPIGLTPPGPDLFQASRHLVRLAVEQGATREFAPIPLDRTPGSVNRGFVLDHFRMMALVARAAAAAGTPIVLDPAARQPDTLRLRTVVVALPIDCNGRTVAARAIAMTSVRGQPAPRQGENATGDALAALLPGLALPAGTLAATFGLLAPREDEAIRIVYAEPCGETAEAVLHMRYSPLRTVVAPDPALPDGLDPAARSVRLQAQVDLDGRLNYATYVGGSRELVEAAARAVQEWRVEPVRINGAPISTPVAVMVEFKK